MKPFLWIIPFVILALVIAILRRRRKPSRAAAKGNGIMALVFLLKRPRELDEATLSAAVKRAFADRDFAIRPVKGHFAVKLDDLVLAVINHAGTYVDDPGRAAERTPDFAVKMALQDHTAWLSVDSVGMTPKGGVERVFRAIGRLLAELAGDDVLALYSPYTSQGIGWRADLLPLLRSKNPLDLFAVKHPEKIVSADADDPQLEAAVQEARRRWPEFVDAFNRRRKGQAFSIKVPFDAGKKKEYMWVEALRIEGAQVHGRLANEPRGVPKLKIGDPVTVSIDELNDSLYIDGRNRFGGFTAAVLSGRKSR